jgi:hypothetical protein
MCIDQVQIEVCATQIASSHQFLPSASANEGEGTTGLDAGFATGEILLPRKKSRGRPTVNEDRTFVWPPGMYEHCTEQGL